MDSYADKIILRTSNVRNTAVTNIHSRQKGCKFSLTTHHPCNTDSHQHNSNAMEKERTGYINLILYSLSSEALECFKTGPGHGRKFHNLCSGITGDFGNFLITISIKGWKIDFTKAVTNIADRCIQAISIILYFYAILETSVTNAVCSCIQLRFLQ